MSSECRWAASRTTGTGLTARRPYPARTAFSLSRRTRRGRTVAACGVPLAGWLARREFRRRGIDPDLAYSIAVWTVPFGLVGARLYHVITDWGAFWPHHMADVPKIWQGGLGIWGAVLGGMLGTWI